jgi:hypothetical protein
VYLTLIPVQVARENMAAYYIAKVTQLNQYVVLLGSAVVAGPFATAAEAVKARDELLATGTASGCCD